VLSDVAFIFNVRRYIMGRLKVREALMPRVVAPVDGDIAFEKKNLGGASDPKWRVKDGLYPCELSSETKAGLCRLKPERLASAIEAEMR
jgi:hypothetical protein